MGEEEASRTPFLYFTDHHEELAKAVRDGRRREFAAFHGFQPGENANVIPDPNAVATFEASRPLAEPGVGRDWRAFYNKLLALRAAVLVPRLAGTRAIAAHAVGPAAVVARWRLDGGAVLDIFGNLGPEACSVDVPKGDLLFESLAGAAERLREGRLEGRTTVAFLGSSG
jgi:1,4-alpha-glucan branching enzyme